MKTPLRTCYKVAGKTRAAIKAELAALGTTATPPAGPQAVLAANGTGFTWAFNGANPPGWKVWRIPTALNPDPTNFQSWRNQATDNAESDNGADRAINYAPVAGFTYGLTGYDPDADTLLATWSNLIVIAANNGNP